MRFPVLSALIVLAVTCSTLALDLTSAGAVTAREAQAHYRVAKVETPDDRAHVVRWNPCQEAIEYRVNTGGLPQSDRRPALIETRAMVDRVSHETGMTFAFQGATSFIPEQANHTSQPTELVIAFVTPDQTSYPLHGNTAGWGGNHYVYASDASGAYQLEVMSGYVVVDRVQTRSWSRSTTASGITRPNLIAHELGHAVGLQHVTDPTQLMYPLLTSRTPGGHYGTGDGAGLDRVGRNAGCLHYPKASSDDLSGHGLAQTLRGHQAFPSDPLKDGRQARVHPESDGGLAA